PSLAIPQWLFTLSIPLAGLLGIIRTLQAARVSLHEDTSAEAVAERMAQEAAPVIDEAELKTHTTDRQGGRK
ncbi:MAG: TRAP transporter small permease, partial [Brevibacterium aurantiacum]|nr:TRAP transporter small permease [Brevibacterium aurantiacum]